MADVHVELVSPERKLWSGEGEMVIATTLEGELGIMANHAPLFGRLVDGGVVRVLGAGEKQTFAAAVQGGFLSVDRNRVAILAERAELGDEVDVAEARSALERALAAPPGDEEAAAEAARQRARLRAAGQEV